MGQIVKRKKKGRPPKVDLATRNRSQPDSDLRRSLRRRNVKYVFDLDDYFDEDEFFADDDEDQRRREKKLKHLLCAEVTEPTPQKTRAPATSASSSDGGEKPCKKRKINEYVYEDMDDENDEDKFSDEDEEEVRERKSAHKAEDSPPGTPGEAASRMWRLRMPDKKALELILDKLQKKDIYGVYVEPVDPEELPDYHDVIEHPMDFATVRNKLRNGLYAAFEEFESDVFLICSNAMQYNSPDTVYYKQARSIQELAKNKFQKMRLSMEHVEGEVKPDQRMRSDFNFKKQVKRSVSRALQEPVGSDFSSGATLATADLRNVTRVVQSVGSEKPGSFDGLVEGNAFLHITNSMDKMEEPVSGKRVLSRCSRKSYVLDENRRATYNISLSQHVASGADSEFSTFEGETKQLVPVGLYSEHSYARSLARFSATLGSCAWKIASRSIEQALPQGYKLGRGWVGEYEPLPTPVVVFGSCTVREPPYLAKKQPASDPRKLGKISTSSYSTKESLRLVSLPEQKLPFLGSGTRPPSGSIIPTQPIRGNAPEMKSSFFLSPGIKAGASPNYSYQHWNLHSQELAECDRKVLQQVELNSKCAGSKPIRKSSVTEFPCNFSASRSFKHPDGNRVGLGGLHDGKAIVNTISDMAKPANYYPQEQQGQGDSDPVQLMKISSEKARNLSVPNSRQVMPSAQSPTGNNSNNACVAATRAWMSIGARELRPVAESGMNVNKNQIYAESLHNTTRDMASHFRGESQVHGFGPIPTMVSNQMAFQNPRMVFPPTDLSRFQMKPTNWRNVTPQMLATRPKQESLPPDLNIGFQSSGLPPSAGVLVVDSQQPDLALQL